MIAADDLLAPVPGDEPGGRDLRSLPIDAKLSDLSDNWKTVRQKRSRGDDTDAQWEAIARKAAAILAEQSKDMEVAAWLTEALVHTEGFAGLAAGGRLIAGLAGHFWDALYPSPHRDDPRPSDPEERRRQIEDARLEPLRQSCGRDDRLPAAVGRVVLFASRDGTPFLLTDCQKSKAWTAAAPEERAERLKGLSEAAKAERLRRPDRRLWDEVRQEVQRDQADLLAKLRHDAEDALAAWHGAAAAVGARVGSVPSPVGSLIELLEGVARTARELAPAEPAAPDGAAAAEGEPDAAVQAAEATEGGGSAPSPPKAERLESREAALRQLADIAAFFRRTEPHTPVAFMVEETVRRARLTWLEWIGEAIPDEKQRETFLERLGLTPKIVSGQ